MVAPAHLYCAKCGTDNPTQAAFCFACGHPLQAAAGGLAISSFTGLLAQHHPLKERYHIIGQVGKVFDIGIQLCTVLGYFHTPQPSIIFRDLKPANILLTPHGQIYLIDFGIARHFKPGQSRDTIAFGSPGYAPPEQYGKTQTTPRADIYALGATLHQLLTGDDPTQTPFRFAPLQLRSQTTPVGLDTLIMRMLEIDENRRPASMHAIKLELQRFAAQRTTRQVGILQPGTMYVYASPLVPRQS